MCIKPRYEPYTQSLVACRHCWACRKNRVDDYVGRGLAESLTAAGVSVLTLTYAGDVPGAVLLLHYDVRKFFMRLRKAGYPLRYILAGEHGSRHNRAHWHVIIYWQKAVPNGLPVFGEFGDWVIDQGLGRKPVRPWPHGHVHSMRFSVSSLRYTIKYLLKDQDLETSVSRFSLSKRPLIGLPFFFRQADEMIEKRVLPRDLFYTFADVLDRHGKPYRFHLRGRAAERYLDRFEIGWRLRWLEPPPLSDYLLERYHFPIARKESKDGLVPHFIPRPRTVSKAQEPPIRAGGLSSRAAGFGFAGPGAQSHADAVSAFNRSGRERIRAQQQDKISSLVVGDRGRRDCPGKAPFGADQDWRSHDSSDSRSRAYWAQHFGNGRDDDEQPEPGLGDLGRIG